MESSADDTDTVRHRAATTLVGDVCAKVSILADFRVAADHCPMSTVRLPTFHLPHGGGPGLGATCSAYRFG